MCLFVEVLRLTPVAVIYWAQPTRYRKMSLGFITYRILGSDNLYMSGSMYMREKCHLSQKIPIVNYSVKADKVCYIEFVLIVVVLYCIQNTRYCNFKMCVCVCVRLSLSLSLSLSLCVCVCLRSLKSEYDFTLSIPHFNILSFC